MASIREKKLKSGNKSYQVQIRLLGHKPISASFRRKTDAQIWIQTTESSIREGRYTIRAEARRHTVSDLVNRYIENVLPQKPKMRVEYSTQLLWWQKKIGHILLADLTSAVIVEYRDRLLKTITYRGTFMSPARVNRYLACLSTALTTAVNEWQWLDDNPLRKVTRLKEPRGRVRYLDDNELEKLLTACKESHNNNLYLAVVLSLATGARRTEVWSLAWKDIDLKNGLITFQKTKNDERRSVPLTGHALDLLRKKAKLRRLDTELIFASPINPKKYFNFRRPFAMALKAAQIKNFRWHDMRHCSASFMVQNGVSLSVVAEILGHRDTSITQRYAHLSPEHLRESVARIDKKMFG